MTTQKLISIRAYSRSKGCSDTAVHKAVKAGKIVNGLVIRDGKKFIDPVIADAEWSTNHNPAYEKVTKKGGPVFGDGEPAPKAVPPSSAPGAPAVPAVGDGTLAAAKKAKAVYDAQLARLDYETRAGKLVPKADVYKALYSAGQELRTSLMAIPDRVVDEMLSAPSRNDAHQMLVEAIASSLEALVDIQNRDISAHR
jgi:hypothetical protein